jgi:hypothetical protein
MYSERVIERRTSAIESAYNVRLHRYSIDDSKAITSHLSSVWDERGRQTRALTPTESSFIWNELCVSRCDFTYWAERYAFITPDDVDGRPKVVTLFPAQHMFIRRMARVEEDMFERMDRGEQRFDAQAWFVHKARQMGLSTFVQLLGAHRANFYQIAGLVGSVDDQKTQAMYKDHLLFAYENLPPWMRSPLTSKTKDRGLSFVHGAQIALQDASQKAGFGQGAKWHFAHVTECASFPDPVTMLENHFFPSISYSIRGMCFLESTSQGMEDWWHTRTQRAREGHMGRWKYFFVPWYAIYEFYHKYPSVDWTPRAETLREAELIERTSPEWMDGQTVRLTREQMWWWEDTRSQYTGSKDSAGTLNEFYKNYPSIPEQSFTHSGTSSFEPETIEFLTQFIHEPVAYEISTAWIDSDLVIDSSVPGAPPVYTVDKYDLVPVRVPVADRVTGHSADPRGYILMYEQPDARFDYFIGMDPAVGISGWSRYNRRKDDARRDNSALQVVRRGFGNQPDCQVAEFVAPIEPVDFALYGYLLGRLFCGRSPEKQALITVEINWHGVYCQNELMQRYNYVNLYQRTRTNDGININYLDQYGWMTNATSIRELWALAKHHLGTERCLVRSKYTIDEMRGCTDDGIRTKTTVAMQTYGKAKSGRHDDRVYALMFALEGARNWHSPMTAEPANMDYRPVVAEQSPRRYSVLESDYTARELEDMEADWESRIPELVY